MGGYQVGELFETELSKDDIQPKNITEGETPLVSSGKENNGIISKIFDEDAKLWPTNTITVDMFGKAFYQPNPYHCVSHGRVNILLGKQKVPCRSLLFVVSTIESTTLGKYQFKEMCTGTKLKEDTIYLPITDNHPDWGYMEEYMKRIEEKVGKNIKGLS